MRMPRYVGAKCPETMGGLAEYSDELFLAFNLVLQWNSLRSFNATFAEKFYGLARTTNRRRRHHVQKWTLLLEVIVPYIAHKMDKMLAQTVENELLESHTDKFKVGKILR